MENEKARLNLVYYAVVIALLLTSIVINYVADYMSSNQVTYVFTTLSQIVCMFILPVTLYFTTIKGKASVRGFLDDFGFKRFKKGELIKVIALGLIAIYVNTCFAQVNAGFLSLIGYKYSSSASTDYLANGWLVVLDLFMTALLPAICEETAHRGLFRVSYRFEPVKYILLSSLMFSLMHQNIAQVFYTFMMGLFFASAVVFTGNIKASMIMHFMINATEVLNDFGAQIGSTVLASKRVFFSLLYSSVIGRIFSVVLAFVGIYFFIKILMSFRKEDYEKQSIREFPRSIQTGVLKKDGFLTIKANGVSKAFMTATIFIGVCCNIFTLTWGLLR